MYSSKEYLQWLKDRTIFKWLAFCMVALYAIELQCTKYFLLYYIKDRFNLTELDAVLYYSLTESLYAIAQIAGGVSLGRYSDRTRNTRKVVIGAMFISFVGNAIYVLQINIPLVIIGRIMMGFPECLQTAVVGKLASAIIHNVVRHFPSQHTTSKQRPLNVQVTLDER